LDEATYYVKTVPISINLFTILWIDLITIISCLLLLLIPSIIIKTITPVKALKFN
jgi:lipoprotein-releasing system permease protein